MTGRGVLYLASAVLVTLLSLGTGLRELFLLCLLLWILFVLLLLSVLCSLLTLRLTQQLDRPAVVRGSNALLSVRAGGFVLCPVLLEWRLRSPDGRKHRCILTVTPGKRGRCYALEMSCPHRGAYTVGAEKPRVLDLLGLFSLPLVSARRRPAPLSLLVYPMVVPLQAASSLPAGGNTCEDSTDGLCGEGDTFADTRLYQEGDSLKRIHWNQTLRTRQLHTRQYEQQSPSPVWLVLDTVLPAGFDPTEYGNRLCDCLASTGWYFVQRGRLVQMTTLDSAETLSADSEQMFAPLYERLASLHFTQELLSEDGDDGVVPTTTADFQPDPGVPRVYVFTCRPDEGLFAYLRQLCPPEGGMVCVAPAETISPSLEVAADTHGVRLAALSDLSDFQLV